MTARQYMMEFSNQKNDLRDIVMKLVRKKVILPHVSAWTHQGKAAESVIYNSLN
jgi:hypothetical protein